MTTLQFLGGAGTVTGSRYLVREGSRAVLVDCGLFQGYKVLRERNWAPFPFDVAALGAVVLTHAHIDHSGALPLLVRAGFRGPIHCSEATYELCRLLLPDSAWLQEEQAEHANRHGYSKHHPALPLYTREDAARALAQFRPVPFAREFAAGDGIRVQLRHAGHILGAAMAWMDVAGRRIVFSGDVGRPHDPLMAPPETVDRADLLVMESTYGSRLHGGADGEAELGRLVAATAARGGTVVTPAFAVGRAQALLLFLHRQRERGVIPKTLPIFMDSPMARSATDLYRRFRADHRLDDDECRALGEVARLSNTPDDSRALDEGPWPKVIVAGSGMATGGRVLHHIERYGPDPRSLILFAGFQAPGTRGESLVHGARELKMFGRWIPIRAEVRNLDMLSAHADSEELLQWLRGFATPPKRIQLTHGEPAAADALRQRIAATLGWSVAVAEHGQVVEV